MIEEKQGTLTDIIFHNEENGFTVLELNTGEDLTTVVGVIPAVNTGEQLRVSGTWTVHSTFGPQFRAEFCERTMPTTSASIFRFLASGAVKGIGLSTARAMVDQFGEHTLEVLENEPERLSSIRGISKKRAEK